LKKGSLTEVRRVEKRLIIRGQEVRKKAHYPRLGWLKKGTLSEVRRVE
jgi:hypothetical protein